LAASAQQRAADRIMTTPIKRDPVFVALTRPQMFAGVTYSYFIANAVIAAEVFLIFKSFWALGVALVIHLVGVMLCLREPRFFDLWITKLSRCPRVKNHEAWGCNSYRP
jgi:type IV secretion system protein VirB3